MWYFIKWLISSIWEGEFEARSKLFAICVVIKCRKVKRDTFLTQSKNLSCARQSRGPATAFYEWREARREGEGEGDASNSCSRYTGIPAENANLVSPQTVWKQKIHRNPYWGCEFCYTRKPLETIRCLEFRAENANLIYPKPLESKADNA